MGYLIAISFWILVIWLIRRDTARRDGISGALWIPTLWAGILLSRSVSGWIGGGAVDSLEGSPIDRLFYFGVIATSLAILSRRNVNWALFFQRNWPIFLFYGFFLVSVLWSESPFSSFKRWFKDIGNIFVAMVILTERNPSQAIRAVFTRCAYVLFPLSVIFVRWFPDLGRVYSRSGGLQIVGVTTQKNSLGILVVVCGLILLWDWLERSHDDRHPDKLSRYLPLVLLLNGIYLLHLSDSQTSILCMIVGAIILLSSRIPVLRKKIGALGGFSLAAALGFYFLDWMFGVKAALLGAMGRDETLTGRTDVWRELLALQTDPVFGTGFLSFWSDQAYQSKLPNWVGFSAHNGYLETYIDGGFVGIFFLVVLLLVSGWRVNRQLAKDNTYVLVQFAVFWIVLIGNYSESHFGRMTPLWFLFLMTSLIVPRLRRSALPIASQSPNRSERNAEPEFARPAMSWLDSTR